MAQYSVPELVSAIRERAGLTQEALARELGVSFPTVNAWERGRSCPRADHLEALHEFAERVGIHRGITVLVIDDDPVSCAVLEGRLDATPIQVTTLVVENGFDGLVMCGMHRPDLVLLDVLMPGIDGVEVARRLHVIPGLEETVVVFVTAATDPEILSRVRATGKQVLVKPVSQGDVDALVASVAEGTPASRSTA